MPLYTGFEDAIKPKAIAAVGASRKPLLFGDFVVNLQRAGFPGRIYPVNPKANGEEIHGLKSYPDLVSIPEHIDLVTATIPAKDIIPMLEDCIKAGIKNVQIFTAGFKESGEPEGIALEEKLVEIATRGKINVLGPNCMGLHIPESKITTWETLGPEPGNVGFISQSGGHAGTFVIESADYGIRSSKIISFGNAAVIDSVDILEYLAEDPATEIICMYLEGVKDGGKLTKLVRDINKTKPIIVWKGGATPSGARAVASHTGSLSGEQQVWDAFFKQTGAVRIDGMEELLNVVTTFLHLRRPTGNRMALVAGGGGNSVACSDICDRNGLVLPPFAEETRKELLTFIVPEGTITRNPIDIAFAMVDLDVLMRSLELSAKDLNIDFVVFALPPGVILLGASKHVLKGNILFEEAVKKHSQLVLDTLTRFDRENSSGKPLVIILQGGLIRFLPGQREQLRIDLLNAGIPTYMSLEQASDAIGKFLKYQDFLNKGSN
ncbi:MAG: CoA-binding protein [Chloroflexota bacterium]|nr:CoA-binding protein [Chloroflexota bacterium]